GKKSTSWMARSGWKESGTVMCRWPVKLRQHPESRPGLAYRAATVRKWLRIPALFACTGLLFAQDVIRVDVNLVRVTATVKNAAGALVGTLRKEDFEIFDNGVRQQIALLTRQTEQPLSVALLI